MTQRLDEVIERLRQLPENLQERYASAIEELLTDEDEGSFWIGASQSALDSVWGNSDDDIYAELLKG